MIDTERIFFPNSRGDTLVGVLHRPAGNNSAGAVILCHGMDSHKNSEKLIFLGRELAQRGILALRFDFSYVGESNGKFEDITYSGEVEIFRAAYELVRQRRDGKIAIFGSSMGGTVALMFAAAELQVAAIAIQRRRFIRRISPVACYPQLDCNAGANTDSRIQRPAPQSGDAERLGKYRCSRRGDKIDCPVLILHATPDEVVPGGGGPRAARHLKNSKRLSILKDADHRLSDRATMQRAMLGSVGLADRSCTVVHGYEISLSCDFTAVTPANRLRPRSQHSSRRRRGIRRSALRPFRFAESKDLRGERCPG
jgi:predicted alpha/beta-hydrolase family hydrolase